MSVRSRALQHTGWQGVCHVTGGGSLLLSELLTEPGASRTVLQATVPYAAQALAELLGSPPEQACSAATARAMAMVAFQKAQALGSPRPFGLGCSASLGTDRIKRGDYRAHVAVQTIEQSLSVRLEFDKPGPAAQAEQLRAGRRQQEADLLEGLWQCLAMGLDLDLDFRQQPTSQVQQSLAPRSWQTLLTGTATAVTAFADQDQTTPRLLLPGSFNPLHAGHRAMLSYAEQRLGCAGAFELSIFNVDKPALDYVTVERRARTFRTTDSPGPLWLTALPTFVEKARRFCGTTFAVGADTLIRIAAPRYYQGVSARNRALAELVARDTRFLVFGRVHERRFQTLDQLRLPKALAELCIGVSETDFRLDMSSSAIRAGRRNAG